MTRMGLHVISNKANDMALAYCARVRPGIMKWMDPQPDVLRRCKEASPNTRHVWRYYWADQRPDRRGDFDAAVVKRVPALRGLIDWVEGWNEYGCQTQTDEQVRLLREFCQSEVLFARKVNDAGMGAAIGGFSTGALDTGDRGFNAVRPLLEFLHQTGPANVWHSHEYSSPYMQWGWITPDKLNQWDHARNVWTGASRDRAQFFTPGIEGWWTLRYRMLRRRLVAAGLANVHMIFTETGIDDIQPRPGGQGKGWRDWQQQEWTSIAGDYAEQQYTYGWQISHDPYVPGWTDFGFATEDPAWNSFALDQTPDMLERVAVRQLALPEGVFAGGGTVEEADVERRFWSILARHARTGGVPAMDLRANLMTGGSFSTLTPAAVEAVVVHHTAADESVTWEAVASYHVQSRGFAGIGYHVGVRNGEIAYLGDLDRARAHVANQNHRYLGLVLAGNYETATPSEADMKALKVAYAAMQEWLGRSVPARGHRDVSPPGYTVCPGRNLHARLGELSGTPETGLALALGKWADVSQAIQPNEAAALYVTMREHGYWPLSDESGARGEVPQVDGYPGIVAQLGRQWTGSAERIYYWDGTRVRWLARHG